MAWRVEHNPLEGVLELLAENGLEDLREPMTILLNAAMKIERERHLGAAPWQRSPARAGHANGFKDKTLKTRVGELALRVPQTRAGDFYPSALERGERSERALKLALAEMYVQGVSTRKVSAVVEQLCGFEVSSTQVSRAAATLDESLEQWRTGALPACPYVVLDARYEKVRQGGQVIDCAVLLAIGVTEQGRRRVLGVSVALSEAEAHWRGFLKSLQERGLHGVKLFIADDHAGLKAARKAVFPAVPWQRCQFHLQRNAQAYVPKQDMKAAVAQTLRAIFTAPEREEAERLLKLAITKFEKTAPKLATWMEENLHEGLAVFAFDPAHRVRLRTSNMLERLNKEIKRRTRVATLFPNEKSLLRLVTAVVGEIDDEWTTGKIYLSMKS